MELSWTSSFIDRSSLADRWDLLIPARGEYRRYRRIEGTDERISSFQLLITARKKEALWRSNISKVKQRLIYDYSIIITGENPSVEIILTASVRERKSEKWKCWNSSCNVILLFTCQYRRLSGIKGRTFVFIPQSVHSRFSRVLQSSRAHRNRISSLEFFPSWRHQLLTRISELR